MMFPPIVTRRQMAQSRQRQSGADVALSCVLVFSASGLLLHCLASLAWQGILPVIR
jgi:hypothetical protein